MTVNEVMDFTDDFGNRFLLCPRKISCALVLGGGFRLDKQGNPTQEKNPWMVRVLFDYPMPVDIFFSTRDGANKFMDDLYADPG